jgi:hypothetical protein
VHLGQMIRSSLIDPFTWSASYQTGVACLLDRAEGRIDL